MVVDIFWIGIVLVVAGLIWCSRSGSLMGPLMLVVGIIFLVVFMLLAGVQMSIGG